MSVEDEIKKLGTEISTKVNDAIKLSKEEGEKAAKLVDDLKKDILEKSEAREKLINEQQKQLDQLATDFKKGAFQQAQVKTFEDQIQDQFDLRKDELTALKAGRVKSLDFSVKAAANMLISTNYTGQIGLTSWDSEVSKPARRQPFIRQLVTNRRVNGMYVAYAEIKNRDGGADTVAEGAKKPQSDFDIVEATHKVEKIAHFFKTSKECLDDITWLRGEINTELIEGINLKLDEQILKGNGISPNLKGIITHLVAPIVPGPPFATAVATPNPFDVIQVAVATIQANNFNPNYAVVHPLDAAAMNLVKDANGMYVLPPYSTADGQRIAGVTIVANSGMTQGDFLVGDFSKDILGIREEITITVGYENDDFTKNLLTILGEMRAVNYIKSNNLGAFARGKFSDVITAITKPAA